MFQDLFFVIIRIFFLISALIYSYLIYTICT